MKDNRVKENSGVIAENNNGTININNGLAAEEAYALMSKLFLDNFYRLQDAAINCANERVEKFLNELRKELEGKHFENYGLFEKPDTQYALYDCMNAYAKYGDDVSLDILIKIMSERLNSDKNFKLKVAIDDAIRIVPKLDQETLNYMTIMFSAKQANFHLSSDVATVVNHFNSLISVFPFEKSCGDFINSLGCLKIDLDTASGRISKVYKVDRDKVEKFLDSRFSLIHGDYSLTYPGIILAIINFRRKNTITHFKLENWIK